MGGPSNHTIAKDPGPSPVIESTEKLIQHYVTLRATRVLCEGNCSGAARPTAAFQAFPTLAAHFRVVIAHNEITQGIRESVNE
ncbi:hypothetical protein R84865_001042 [Carnimonas sp. R-84865]